MIDVSVSNSRITVKGHANYAGCGKDIVCAGVSTLTQSLIESIEDLTDDKIKYEISPGWVDINFKDLSEKSKALIDSFFLGICMIANENPEHVRISGTKNTSECRGTFRKVMRWAYMKGRKIMKLFKSRRKFNLQLFAEGDGNGADGNGAGTGEGAEGGGVEGGDGFGEGTGSFDDFLSNPENQAEFDRRIAKALSTQKAKLDGEYQTNLADAKKEAEKLAKMNAEQKKQYEAEKKDQLIKDQQAEIDKLKHEALKAELSKEAARIMKSDHSIIATQDMLDFVVGDDADTTKANIAKLVGIIQEDRKLQEEKRATGRTPRNYDNNNNTMSEIDKRIAKYK